MTLLMGIVSLMVISGCSNITFVKAREGCGRGVGILAWDICENISDPVPTAREKIRGEADVENDEEAITDLN